MQPSHLFTVRLWRARVGGGREEWRGVVQHVLTRETFTFRTWNDLIVRLVMLAISQNKADAQIHQSKAESDTSVMNASGATEQDNVDE
ncbi:MAG: hypothetical protein EYC68_08180 [Chloroflexota bacterium]|nr:MAG: hypothetical protein EYC68_08180 [Chloroflexota bacterium]